MLTFYLTHLCADILSDMSSAIGADILFGIGHSIWHVLANYLAYSDILHCMSLCVFPLLSVGARAA